MKNSVIGDYLFLLSGGMVIFIILTVSVMLICSVTLNRVRQMKEYCDTQFEKISNQIEQANLNTEDLTEAVKQLTDNLKNKTNELL
jgi:uncharacterized protein YoxC